MSEAQRDATKKHHTVPRFYLRRFADRGTDRLHVLHKPTMKRFEAHIDDVAASNRYYTMPGAMEVEGLPRDWLEHGLADFDSDSAQDLEQLVRIARVGAPIPRLLRARVAAFIAVQAARTDEIRRAMRDVQSGLLERFEQMGTTRETVGEDLRWVFDQPGHEDDYLQTVATLLDSKLLSQVALAIEGHYWTFGMAPERNLCTSDNPVVRRGHDDDPLRGTNGFGSPGVEIAFPLSPGRVLVMHERTYHGLVGLPDGQLLRLRDENVAYYNSFQVSHSIRQVYARHETALDLAERICGERPHLRDPERPRLRSD